MRGLKKLKQTAQMAKQIAQVQKAINQCPICTEHQNAIKKHVLEGHKP
jgi:hypothetical protein